MGYVERKGGVIVAYYCLPQPGMQLEEVSDNDPEVVAFNTEPPLPTVDTKYNDLEKRVKALEDKAK